MHTRTYECIQGYLHLPSQYEYPCILIHLNGDAEAVHCPYIVQDRTEESVDAAGADMHHTYSMHAVREREERVDRTYTCTATDVMEPLCIFENSCAWSSEMDCCCLFMPWDIWSICREPREEEENRTPRHQEISVTSPFME